jgi:O-antigen/teichoic acid export membrane protein
MRARLGRNVAANMLNAGASIGASLISLPFILHHVGTAGYGVWTIALTFVLYLTGAEAGFGPATQRWVAVSLGRGSKDTIRHLLWTSVVLYTAAGLVLMAALVLAAPGFVSLFDFPQHFTDDATRMFRLVGVVMLVTLIAAALGNVLLGLERTVASALSAGGGSIAYLVMVVVLVPGDDPLLGLAIAALAQQGVTAAGRLIALRDVIGGGRPGLLRGREWRELLLFSAKLQLVVAAWLVNTQSDKIVVGLVATSATVGQLGIGSQFADAGRMFASAGLIPVMASLAVLAGRGAHDALAAHFAWAGRLWIEGIVGGTVIGAAVLYPLTAAWLGAGHGEAALLGAFLVLATGVSLVSGVAVGHMRAIGQPGLEARYGLVVIVVNLAATIPLAIVAGARGVVAGTFVAYTIGTAWFFRRFRERAPEMSLPSRADLARAVGLALVAGAFAAAVGVAAVELLPAGVALVPVAAALGLAYAGYLSALTGTSLRPSALAQMLRAIATAPPAEPSAPPAEPSAPRTPA